MLREETAGRVRAAYEAFGQGNPEEWYRMLATGMVWHSPLRGRIEGAPAVQRSLEEIRQLTDEWTMRVHDVLASDDHLVVLLTNHFRRGERIVDDRSIDLYHVDAEGRLVEGWAYFENIDELRRLASA